MKNIFKSLVLISALIFTSVFAYVPVDGDAKVVDAVYTKVARLLENKTDSQKEKILTLVSGLKMRYNNDRISYVLDTVVAKFKTSGDIYDIVSVVDGDTIKIMYNGEPTSVRIIGIDTPEKYTTRTGYKECMGDNASAFASEFFKGWKARIEQDPSQDKTDKYGRLLAHVFLPDGTYYEEAAIQKGFGFYYLYNKPAKYDDRLKKAEELAKKNNVGVWANCDGKREPVKAVVEQTSTKVDTILTTTPSAPSIPVTVTPAPTPEPAPVSGGNYSCSIVKTTCGQMASCAEARYYLTSCGVSRLDGDKDGTPCESLCK